MTDYSSLTRYAEVYLDRQLQENVPIALIPFFEIINTSILKKIDIRNDAVNINMNTGHLAANRAPENTQVSNLIETTFRQNQSITVKSKLTISDQKIDPNKGCRRVASSQIMNINQRWDNSLTTKKLVQKRKFTGEAEENIRRAEYDFMTVLNTILEETPGNKDLINTLMGLETKNHELTLGVYFRLFTNEHGPGSVSNFSMTKFLYHPPCRNCSWMSYTSVTLVKRKWRKFQTFLGAGHPRPFYQQNKELYAFINVGKSSKTQ